MEMNRSAYEISLADPSHVGEVRRTAVKVAELLRLSEEQSNNAALIATEMASNVVKHAKAGSILIQKIGANGATGLQLLAIDKGPGIKDVGSALSDGWSSSDTLGGGFGAMHRLSSAFDLYTQAGVGTVVLCEIWKGGKDPGQLSDFSIGIVSTPYPGEEFNGDGWVIKNSADLVLFVVVDGLGHGVLASEAAREAERIVRENSSNSPTVLLEDCHKALAKTRGAAIGIAALHHPCGRLLTFAGTGNIAGSVSTSEASRGLASHNGTLGHVMSRVQAFTYPWSEESLLVIHSDGVSMRWNLDSYPGLRAKSPGIVAAVLHRDFSRAHDDSTILVARQGKA
jgi:anti-sigma regulatory factor (Ser/Thr protein kinase)